MEATPFSPWQTLPAPGHKLHLIGSIGRSHHWLVFTRFLTRIQALPRESITTWTNEKIQRYTLNLLEQMQHLHRLLGIAGS